MLGMILNQKDINISMQVGDLIYARKTEIQSGAEDLQTGSTASSGTGINHLVGVLRDIKVNQNEVVLMVDESMLTSFYMPKPMDFLMFSKYNQGDNGVLGYYAKAKFVNDSTQKAEIFAVSSEIIINSQ